MNQVKERPILMNGEMVRAVLEGRKTQTRRILKPQPWEEYGSLLGPSMYAPTVIDQHGCEHPGLEVYGAYTEDGEFAVKCPYGKPGDRLWVREAFRSRRVDNLPGDVAYRADHPGAKTVPNSYGHSWKPSIHMPRWASRITLEITDVRVERLQDITESDCDAEGLAPFEMEMIPHFKLLWESINGAGSWDANPWVWVIEFRRVEQEVKAA
ncbi:hypothetical protein [Marinobacter sp. JSM 1782161]|uniref:hypothetical protein n=1 Tax=Marinobacter sp. JSM 1782161 TaxID=2685906 RepID=UPI0014040A94|nr:hypothetical protein [Marinobacter sp. JSM 1782161]